MDPELLVLSRSAVEDYRPSGREVCISIGNPNTPPVQVSGAFIDVLRVVFTDIAGPSPHTFDLLFHADHARQIVEFVRTHAGVERIVIHCVAGQSRSPAVAMGICELFGWPLHELEERHPLWNTWVRTELVRVGRECQSGKPDSEGAL